MSDPVDEYRLRPMSEFFDAGLFYDYNAQIMNPLGLHVTFYLDDEDGQSVYGWHVIPLEEARALGVLPTPAQAASRVAAFHAFIGQETSP